MPPRSPNIQLKERYYLEHFEEMLGFVESHYAHALGMEETSFLHDFRALSLDASCLYVRLANRKGRVFSRRHLRYLEIVNLNDALDELRAGGFVLKPDESHFQHLLALQGRERLLELLEHLPHTAGLKRSSLKKAEILSLLSSGVPFSACFDESVLSDHVVQAREETLAYLLFLHFGRSRADMSSFALRDLGLIEVPAFKKNFTARYESRAASRAAFLFSRLLQELGDKAGVGLPRLQELSEQAPQWPVLDDPEIEALRHRSLYRLGRSLERAGDADRALMIHRLSDQFPATERTARLLLQANEREAARTFLEQLIDHPSCDEELIFAEDLLARKFQSQRVGRFTALLRDARVLPLDEAARGYPEAAAARYFQRHGARAVHTENEIWGLLFGLLCWDLLLGEETAPLHHGFDWKPTGLDSGIFYEKYRVAFEERFALLDDLTKALSFLNSIWELHEGTPNYLVAWNPLMRPLLEPLVQLAPQGALADLLRDMARDHRQHRRGFPDLMIVDGDQLSFVEIKAEGDQIQRHQLAKIERLRRLGFAAEINRVQWVVDPVQEYVVVDIETTGAPASRHRITEIGAVRVRGGEIVEEWSSLVNPERRIPAFIRTLTGITDEMVAGAPTFDRIGPDFRAFLGDAVFVAHRAPFDYGFLQAEFQRIGQDLRCATLCTVVEMRRYFPGLPSYGLAKLCAHFEVPLESHHRALCDARATAHLLLKINDQRERKASGASMT
ncbi:exonuclease domain-containing protein [Microcoleus sp.]|uniref:exonuclease domain-containing protein n=1 Tax=Microcoleus sp. TaxID=44472 RepID=UPI0035932CBC